MVCSGESMFLVCCNSCQLFCVCFGSDSAILYSRCGHCSHCSQWTGFHSLALDPTIVVFLQYDGTLEPWTVVRMKVLHVVSPHPARLFFTLRAWAGPRSTPFRRICSRHGPNGPVYSSTKTSRGSNLLMQLNRSSPRPAFCLVCVSVEIILGARQRLCTSGDN